MNLVIESLFTQFLCKEFHGLITCFGNVLALCLVMPPTLKKLMGHIAFGACVGACVGGCVRVSHFLYLL